MAEIRIELTARQWATVDTEMDNSAYLIRESAVARGEVAEQDMLRLGSLGLDAMPISIRQSGSTQVPWVGPDKAWPPDGQNFSLTLTDTQWQFIATELRKSLPTYERLGDESSRRLTEDALNIVEDAIGK